MKYCFLTGLYGRTDSLMVKRHGRSLVEAGYEVYMVLCDDKPDEVKDGIHFISTGFKPNNRIDRLFTQKRILQKAIAIDADYYQVSDPELLSIVRPLKKKGGRVIFNLREFYPDLIMHKEYIPKPLRKPISLYNELEMRKYLPLYDIVFIVTELFDRALRDKWHMTNTMVIANFPWLHKDFSLSYKEYCQRGDVLCYEGTIYYESRQENVFKALEHLPQVKYLLAGKIDDKYGHIKELPYWPKVDFINGFKYEELPEILGRATIANVFRDFFGDDGGFGVIKIFDAMEAALPILIADTPMYRGLIHDYNCGLYVDPNDASQIESAIRYLVEHKQEAYQMGQNGRKAVMERFCWEKEAERYLAAIKSIK